MSRQALSYRILKILKLHLLRYQQRGKGFLIWEQSSNGVAGYQRRNLSHHSRKVRESESEVAQLCLTLCNPMDCSLSGSSVHGTFQARVLEWIAISFSRGSSRAKNWTRVSRIAGRRFTIWATRDQICVPVLAGRFLTTGPPGKSLGCFVLWFLKFFIQLRLIYNIM